MEKRTEEIIIQHSKSCIGDFLGFCFLLLIGCGLVYFAGGVMSWVFFCLFALCALLPLISALRSESFSLSIQNGFLHWEKSRNGKICDSGELLIDNIEKVEIHQTPGTEGLVCGDIYLITKDQRSIELPTYLSQLDYQQKITEAVQRLKKSIVITKTNPNT
jgi:hypothetical protein